MWLHSRTEKKLKIFAFSRMHLVLDVFFWRDNRSWRDKSYKIEQSLAVRQISFNNHLLHDDHAINKSGRSAPRNSWGPLFFLNPGPFPVCKMAGEREKIMLGYSVSAASHSCIRMLAPSMIHEAWGMEIEETVGLHVVRIKNMSDQLRPCRSWRG